MDFISVGRGKEMSVKSDQKKQITGLLYSVCGGVLFAAGVNLFITPLDLYNGGFMGIAQLIRTFLTSALHLSFGQTDIAGIIYFIVNRCHRHCRNRSPYFYPGSGTLSHR